MPNDFMKHYYRSVSKVNTFHDIINVSLVASNVASNMASHNYTIKQQFSEYIPRALR